MSSSTLNTRVLLCPGIKTAIQSITQIPIKEENIHMHEDQDAPLLKTNPASTSVQIRDVNTA